ncbi:energy transducer TonB [Taibaiella soli]|uniref:TonB C-terminal domain-containing protein n=1 Tax=Taibaiella soli TaxID=1649169 RepID=A0A2W2A7W3_9BACT|nr:energy transducer TonB [Taibaiella soli]PZF71445.1 hypothetical protein DN068_19345 [Taibaiella soli]
MSNKIVYKEGKIISSTFFDESEKEIDTTGKPYDNVIELKYKGGLVQFIVDNIKYPPEDRDEGIQGKVYVRIFLDANGKMVDYDIIKSVSKGCDREVARLISIMPDWEPARVEGNPVDTRVVFPITFRLE